VKDREGHLFLVTNNVQMWENKRRD